jgi:hypothetical protein
MTTRSTRPPRCSIGSSTPARNRKTGCGKCIKGRYKLNRRALHRRRGCRRYRRCSPFSVGGDDAAGRRHRMVERYRGADPRRPFRVAPVSRQKWGTTTSCTLLAKAPVTGRSSRPRRNLYPGRRTWSRRAYRCRSARRTMRMHSCGLWSSRGYTIPARNSHQLNERSRSSTGKGIWANRGVVFTIRHQLV